MSCEYCVSTSSGHVVGSMPTGTSLKVLSPKIGGFTSLNTNPKVCVTPRSMHDTRHLTMCMLAKRCRTEPTMVLPRAPSPGCTTVKKPPISVLARPRMNSSEFWRYSS